MKDFLLFLLLLLALAGCRNEPKNAGAAGAVAEQPAAAPQGTGPQQPATAEASAEKKDVAPTTGSRPAYTPPQSRDVLTITARSAQARPGADVCVAFQAKGFVNLLAMQFTIAWDPGVLEFKALNNPGLPYLDRADFGYNRLQDGLLPFVWINDALQATTVPDESVVFEVCFKATGASGQSTAIRFQQQPTPFEVVNINEEILKLEPVEGRVTIE